MFSSTERIRKVAAGVLDSSISPLSAEHREEVVERVAALVTEEIERERSRAVRLCLKRADLWKETPSAGHPDSAEARTEARARQNEARVLADLIASKTEGDRFLRESP